MKRSGFYGLFFSIACCMMCKEPYSQSVYIASTPADPAIRSFLNIPQGDSIDFIRWELRFIDTDSFTATVNYGIGQANTLGFQQGGKHLTTSGAVRNIDNGHQLVTDRNITLTVIKINENLLHVMDDDGSLLSGNDGWNYLFSKKSAGLQNEKLKSPKIKSPDNIEGIYAGRTPCNGLTQEYDINTPGDCFKLKWLLTLNRNNETKKPSSFKLNYTLHRSSIIEGKWSIDDQGIIRLFTNGKEFLKLISADDDVLYFVDKQNRLFNGDENFSYAINKR